MTTESLPNVGTQVQKDKADEDIFFNNWFHLVTRETPAENREVVSVISDRYTETWTLLRAIIIIIIIIIIWEAETCSSREILLQTNLHFQPPL